MQKLPPSSEIDSDYCILWRHFFIYLNVNLSTCGDVGLANIIINNNNIFVLRGVGRGRCGVGRLAHLGRFWLGYVHAYGPAPCSRDGSPSAAGVELCARDMHADRQAECTKLQSQEDNW